MLKLFLFLMLFVLSHAKASNAIDLSAVKQRIQAQVQPETVPAYRLTPVINMTKVSQQIPSQQAAEHIIQDADSELPQSSGSLLLHLRYTNGEPLLKQLRTRATQLLSKQGRVVYDKRTNTLWLHDDVNHLQQIQQWLAVIDRPVPQVLIKTRIVNVDDSQLSTLGINFSTSNGHGQGLELPGLTLPIARLHNDTTLDLQLSALEQKGLAKIVSSPELLTENLQAAKLESGENVPYQEQTASGATSVAFKKAVMRLSVQPEVLPKHQVRLALEINQDKVGAVLVNGVPVIRTQHLLTQARVQSGETLVIGGIYENLQNTQHEGVRGLQHFPVLGNLFKRHKHDQQRRELLIFVTPEVV